MTDSVKIDTALGAKEQEILEKYDRESVTRQSSSQLNKGLITLIAVLYSLFHLYTTFYPLPTLIQRAVHVGIGAVLILLIYPASKKSRQGSVAWYDWLWVIAGASGMVYLINQYNDIMTVRGGIPNTADIVMAIITVLVVLEVTRRVTGWILVIFSLIFLSYPFISSMDFMPDSLLTRPYDVGDIFGQLYLKTEGLYSSAVGASVSFIFLFILFGAFLSKSGMG